MNRIRTGTWVLAGPPPASSGRTARALSASMARSRAGPASSAPGENLRHGACIIAPDGHRRGPATAAFEPGRHEGGQRRMASRR